MGEQPEIIPAPSAHNAPSIVQNMPQTTPQNVTPVKRGRGRPPGKLNEATRIAQRERAAFNLTASRMAKKLLRSQAVIALGTHHIVTRSIDDEGKVHINIVRDEKRQEKLLEEGTYGKDYLILEGTPGDFRAADSILNRAWGKPTETIDLGGEVQFSLIGLATQRAMLDGNQDLTVLPNEETPMLAPGAAD